MFEELYSPIPDTDAYLAKLGLLPTDVSAADPEALNRLIYAHQTHIPFEDLSSCHFRENVSLGIRDLYDKMILGRRGGYCYEMNALFTQLLTDLGYDVISVFCRIVNGRDFIPHCSHRACIVRIGRDLYYCDVGYGGPQPAGAVKIREGEHALIHGEWFHIRRYDTQWWCLSRTDSEGAVRDIIHFNLFAQTRQEFLPLNYFASHSPDSVFTKKYMINRRTDTGSVNITDRVFTRIENGCRSTREFESFDQMKDLLREEFFIEI